MRLFIDTSDIDEIRKAMDYGIIEGVTTNPSSINKAVERYGESGKINLKDYIKKILKSTKGPVSLEVIGTSYAEMFKEAKHLFKTFNPINNNVYIKIPVCPAFKKGDESTFDGIKTIKSLSKAGIPVNCTLVFSPEQALLAAKAGAKFISPFAGRLDNLLRDSAKIKYKKEDYYPFEGMIKNKKLLEFDGLVSGIHLIQECVDILKLHNLKTEVLAASLRNPRQVREVALVRADIATLPPSVLDRMLDNILTMQGMKKFTDDVVPEYAKIVRGK